MNQHWKKGILVAALAGGLALAASPATAYAETASENCVTDTTDQETKRSGWFGANGKWFYYDPVTGEKAVGWKKIAGKSTTSWYYFNQYGVMQVGWKLIGGKYYHFDSEGRMQTGWQKISGKWYFLKGGVMKTGWIKQGGVYYYFAPKTGAAVTGAQKINGKWYYFDESSLAMKTGLITIDGEKYFFKPGTGTLATGWVKDNGDWYYCKSNGSVTRGLAWIGNAFYAFDTNGRMLKNMTVGTNEDDNWYNARSGYVELDANGEGDRIKIYVGDSQHKWYRLELYSDGTFSGTGEKRQKTEEPGVVNQDLVKFSGRFANFRKIGDYGYSMKIQSVSGVENFDELDAYKEFTKGATFYLYFPGTGKDKLVAGFDQNFCLFDNGNQLKNVVLDNPDNSGFTPYDGDNSFR